MPAYDGNDFYDRHGVYDFEPRTDVDSDGSVTCFKRGYRSEREAKQAHRMVSWRFRAYRCPDCNLWHVTNQEKR